jgi:hypothetical protein
MSNECTFLKSDLDAIWNGWKDANVFDRAIFFLPGIIMSAYLILLFLIIVLRDFLWKNTKVLV